MPLRSTYLIYYVVDFYLDWNFVKNDLAFYCCKIKSNLSDKTQSVGNSPKVRCVLIQPSFNEVRLTFELLIHNDRFQFTFADVLLTSFTCNLLANRT